MLVHSPIRHGMFVAHASSSCLAGDMIVQFDFGKSSAEALESAGFSSLTFNSYRGYEYMRSLS